MANEKRLIDANKIMNGIALYTAENAYLNDTALDVLKMVADWLKCAPIVDAVEVVRCKDCKHSIKRIGKIECRCELDGKIWDIDDFCSYGERREGE